MSYPSWAEGYELRGVLHHSHMFTLKEDHYPNNDEGSVVWDGSMWQCIGDARSAPMP